MNTKVLSGIQGHPMETCTSTAAKNYLGSMLDRVSRGVIVSITRNKRASAVMMSVEAYEALLAQRADPLAALRADFDRRIAQMQTPQAKVGARALFSATPRELGEAAVKAAKKRG